MPKTDIRKTSRGRDWAEIDVDPVDAPVRVELTGSIGGYQDVRFTVGQLSIGYDGGIVIVRDAGMEVRVWPDSHEVARFAAGGHAASYPIVAPNVLEAGSPQAPLVRLGPGGDYVEDYDG